MADEPTKYQKFDEPTLDAKSVTLWAKADNANSTVYPVKIDKASGALTSIDYAHHEVHEGNVFRAGMNYALSNAEVATFSLLTPDTAKWLHVTWQLTATADGIFNMKEDISDIYGGSGLSAIKHNRNTTVTSGATCLRGMTGADLITVTGGTTVLNAILGTGKGNTISRETSYEFILKQNSQYLFSYTNGVNANVVLLALSWYEHTSIV